MESIKRTYNVLSAVYDFFDTPFEVFRYRKARHAMCGDLKGRVLDAGVGTGKNLPYYTADAQVTGIDLSEGMLHRAARRAARAKCHVELRRMDASKLEFPDGHFDACVSTYMFCTLPDELQMPVLRELLRVTKPGGQVRILEHRFSRRWWRRLHMKSFAPFVKLFYHSRYDHTIGDAVRACGAKVVEERFVASDIEKMYILEPIGFHGSSIS